MSSKAILYSYWCSSCSWRVRAALHLKSVSYTYKAVNLLMEEQKTSEFLRVNPLGRVPAFIHNGAVLVESFAIIEYIEEVFSSGIALLPKDFVARAQARAVALQIVAAIQPYQNIGILETLEGKGHLQNSPWAKQWIENGFEKLEKLLNPIAGKYCVGDTLTVGDLCLVPQVFNARRFNVDMNKFPLIKRLDEFLSSLPAFSETHPQKQPDALTEEQLRKLGV